MAGEARRTFSGKGRKRADADRYPCGKIRATDRTPKETPEQIQATVLAYRRKLGLPSKHLDNKLAAWPFGCLALTEAITGLQYDAGVQFGAVVARWNAMQGIPIPSPRGLDLTRFARFTDDADQLDKETLASDGRDPYDPDLAQSPEEARAIQARINTVKREYADMMAALLDLERSASYRGTIAALREAILFGGDLSRDMPKLGNLRCGLNTLVRLWRLAGRDGD